MKKVLLMENGFQRRMILYRLDGDLDDLKLNIVFDTGFCDWAGDEKVKKEIDISDPGVLVYDAGSAVRTRVEFINCDEAILGVLSSQPSPVAGWYLETSRDVCEPIRLKSLKDWLISQAARYEVITDEWAFQNGSRYGDRIIAEIPYRWGHLYARWLAVYDGEGRYQFSVSRIGPGRIIVRSNGEIVAHHPEWDHIEVY